MSVKALTWAFDQPISATDKVVLLALADHANEHGLCWPSISLLVQRAHVGERTVQRSLRSLEDSGFIISERRKRENGSDTSNLYRLCLNCVSQRVSAEISVDQRVSGGAKLTPYAGGEGVTQTGGEGVIQTGGEGGLHDTPRTIIKNHHIEPPISFDAEFEEFWAAYPPKPANPRKKAKDKYIAIRKQKVSHETIVNAAKKYAAMRSGEDPKFTAQAVTWLNQWRFEDDYEVDGGASGPELEASDEELNKLAAVYPGHIGDRERAKKVLNAEMAKGVALSEICVAAEKYSLFCKGNPYENRRVTPSMLEPWLQFKWREMEAYEICRVGADRIKTVRAVKVGK